MSKPKRAESSLDVDKILRDFKKSELLSQHRTGTFKIDAPFEEAVKSVATAKQERNPSKNTKGAKHGG